MPKFISTHTSKKMDFRLCSDFWADYFTTLNGKCVISHKSLRCSNQIKFLISKEIRLIKVCIQGPFVNIPYAQQIERRFAHKKW